MSSAGGDSKFDVTNPKDSAVTEALNFSYETIQTMSYSLRQEPVNYNLVKNKFVNLFNSKFSTKNKTDVSAMILAVGISLNNESLRFQQGRYFRVGNWDLSYETLLSIIKEANTADLSNPLDRINASKTSITIARIARAFAVDNIKYLSMRPDQCRFDPNLSPNLPVELRFPFVIYGLDNNDLSYFYNELVAFYEGFDRKITLAYENGYIKDFQQGGKKRNWSADFQSYIEFRAVDKVNKPKTPSYTRKIGNVKK